MSEAAWTDRQKREAEFYRGYADRQFVSAIDFAPVEGRERRPWNPYWYVYDLARTRFVGPWQRLLDFGCGVGIAAVRFAHLGYQVDGFDICDSNITAARELASHHRYERNCRFSVMAAEQLRYPDDTFDMVVGIDILHHVDIPRAIDEAHRVLKPGGLAVFKEHMEVPMFEPIRNSTLGRVIAPKDASLDNHITPDERKLTRADADLIHRQFASVETVRFTLLSRMDRLLPQCSEATRGRLQRLDHRMMQICPPLGRLGGTAVLVCQK